MKNWGPVPGKSVGYNRPQNGTRTEQIETVCGLWHDLLSPPKDQPVGLGFID